VAAAESRIGVRTRVTISVGGCANDDALARTGTRELAGQLPAYESESHRTWVRRGIRGRCSCAARAWNGAALHVTGVQPAKLIPRRRRGPGKSPVGPGLSILL
jgi:hypothetical protein